MAPRLHQLFMLPLFQFATENPASDAGGQLNLQHGPGGQSSLSYGANDCFAEPGHYLSHLQKIGAE